MCIHKTHYPPNFLIMNSRTCKFSGLDETETLLSSLIENLFLYLLRICFPFAILDTLYYVFTALITHTYSNPAGAKRCIYIFENRLLSRSDSTNWFNTFSNTRSLLGGWRKVGDDVVLLSCRKLSSQGVYIQLLFPSSSVCCWSCYRRFIHGI